MSIQEIIIKIKGLVGKIQDPKYRYFIALLALWLLGLFMLYWAYTLGKIRAIDEIRQVTAAQAPEIAVEYPPYVPQAAISAALTPATSALQTDTPRVIKPDETTHSNTSNNDTGRITASKSGSVFYPSGCLGVNRIKPENRIYFTTQAEAIARGYTQSKLCK